MNRLIFLAILTCNCGEASTPTPLSLSFALLTLFVFTKYSLPLTSAAQWYFKSRLIKSFGLRDIYVCICMIFFCTEHFFLFSLSIFTTVVHLCMPQEPIRNWKCGNENVRKKTLKYILTLTHSVGLCFWLYDGALESLITQLRKKKHNIAICDEEASAWNSSFVFLSVCLFLGIFLRCFVPVWLSRSHSERCRNKLVLHFNTIVVSACRMWIPFKDSVTLTESLCVLFSSCLGCKILSIESRCWALWTSDIHFRWDLDCNSTWN